MDNDDEYEHDHDDDDDDDEHKNDNDNNNDDSESLLMKQLLAQVRAWAAKHSMAMASNVDVNMARMLLQVMQGNIRKAAQLYWDDFWRGGTTVRQCNNSKMMMTMTTTTVMTMTMTIIIITTML